jgi:hypothetical protein
MKAIPLSLSISVAAFLAGCTLATNLEKKPTQWVTVKDVATGKPIPHVALVYYGPAKAYFIVGAIGESIPYVSDERGRAHVPEGVSLRPPDQSNYELDSVKTAPEDNRLVEVYYLRRIKKSNPKT